MAAALNAELVAELHEQVQLGLEEAAESDSWLASCDFGPLADVSFSSRWLLRRLEALRHEEAVVVGLRFGIGAPGVDRASVALLLRRTRAEVERLERNALAWLLLAGES
jgi:hypothetical protein